MDYSLTWLPDVLRAAGLEVLEVNGWRTNGHGDMGTVQGVLCHHTCGPVHGDLPDLDVLVHGRPDLGGPLCNLGLGRSGKLWITAAGKGWHAGKGQWHGIVDANAHMIGIEAENTGETSGPRADTWPDVQMDSYRRACAAILRHVNATSEMCAGHKEYALPHGRKDDPDFDMVKFRADVARIMGAAPPLVTSKPVRKGTVNINDLNVRSNASAKAITIGILNEGDIVVVLSESMNGTTRWFSIERDSSPGYVAAQYVTLE